MAFDEDFDDVMEKKEISKKIKICSVCFHKMTHIDDLESFHNHWVCLDCGAFDA